MAPPPDRRRSRRPPDGETKATARHAALIYDPLEVIMKRLAFLLFAGLVVVASAHTLHAQAEEEPEEVRYITVATFNVPYGETRQQVNMWIDSMMVPYMRLDPSLLSLRIGSHYYGSSAGDIVIISEWATWDAIAAPCEPCDAWMAENEPEEGTPEAEKWDDIFATFIKYYSKHSDEIYVVPMSRTK